VGKINYSQLKKKAIQLRKRGWSYGEIGRELGVAKSSVRLWCMNVLLTPEDRKRLYTKQIMLLARGPNCQKERRKREIAKIVEEAEKEIQTPLFFDAYQLFGAALYWAEGDKTRSFEITNSDPYFMLFMVKWFERVFKIPPQDLKARLNIYPQQNEEKIKRFWSQLTGIPLENFGKSFVKPPNKGYKKNNLYYGTIKIRVPKGTNMRHRTFGWIKAVLKEVDSQVKLVQKEWRSLKEVPRPVNFLDKIKI
jgi:hypothetical protein